MTRTTSVCIKTKLCASLLALSTLPGLCERPIDNPLKAQRNANAIQSVYQNGVPHTNKQGKVMLEYSAAESFFSIGLWGSPLPNKENNYAWDTLKGLHYNTVWPWEGSNKQEAIRIGEEYGMQLILMAPMDEEAMVLAGKSPAILANVWADEPIGKFGDGKTDMDKYFADFIAYKEKAAKAAPGLPIFINDAPWISSPATSWWLKWNTAGGVSCHDNYPFMVGHNGAIGSRQSIGMEPNGIPQTVSLAVAANKEKVPVWVILGAFQIKSQPTDPHQFRFPTPTQLRAQVYAALIHGATGIHYFIMDSFVSRDGGVVGMSPHPEVSYAPTHKHPATPTELVQSRALWEQAGVINDELAQLTPVILAPTVGDDFVYKVDVTGPAVTTTPIRCLLKPHPEGGYVLMTVNLDDAVLQVQYTFPGEIAEAETMFENQPARKLNEDGKSFNLQYEPYAAHVFRIKMKEN